MNPPNDHRDVYFESQFSSEDHQGYVHWVQGQYDGYWEAQVATKLGTALLMTAGVALAEANAAIALLDTQEIFPGDEQYTEKLNAFLTVVRRRRMLLSPQLTPIFGHHSQEPLVEIGWYKVARTVTIEGAIEEASIILDCANTAIVDGLLSKVLESAGTKKPLAARIFSNLRKARRESFK